MENSALLPPTREGPLAFDDLQLASDGDGGYVGRRPGYRFAIDPGGDLHFSDRPSGQIGAIRPFFWIAGIFDLTDLVMRAHGHDPYAFDKRRVLELTRQLRDKMQEIDRRLRIARALAALPVDLEALLARSDLSATAKRQTVLDLWNEMAEGPTPEGQAGDAARRVMQPLMLIERDAR